MRTLALLAVALGGCAQILGITDPSTDGPGSDVGRCVAPPDWAQPDTYALPPGTPGFITVGDFDSDDSLDVAVGLTDQVVILHGDGTGKLARPQLLDLPGDGVLTGRFGTSSGDDLLAWTVGGASVNLRRQDGSNRGSFLPLQTLPRTFNHVRRVQSFGELTTTPGVVVQDDDGLWVFQVPELQFGSGNFTQTDQVGSPGDQLIAIGEFNDTSGPDIALMLAGGGVAIAPQGTNGKFAAPGMIAPSGAGAAAAFGHLAGDFALDLLVASSSGGALFVEDQPGTIPMYMQSATVPGVTGGVLQIADVDGDMLDDIVVADGIIQQCPNNSFSTLVPVANTSATVVQYLSFLHKPALIRIVNGSLEVRNLQTE